MGSRLKKFFLNLDLVIASVALVLVVAITVANVFMRFVLHDPVKWAEEASLALFVWLTFIGASSVMKGDEHVSIDIIFDKASESVKKILYWIKYIVMLAVLLFVFIVLGYELTVNAWDKITPILRIRYTFIDIAIPLGGLLASVQLIRLMIKNARKAG